MPTNSSKVNKRKDVTMEEYRAVAEGCTACKVVGASVRNFNGKVVYGTQNSTDTMIRGWSPSMATIYDLDLVAGRMLNQNDEDTTSPVAIIGQDIRENLLGDTDPLGKDVRIDGRVYRVIGVGKKEGKTLGQSRDNYVIMPDRQLVQSVRDTQQHQCLGESHGHWRTLRAGHRPDSRHHALATARPSRGER